MDIFRCIEASSPSASHSQDTQTPSPNTHSPKQPPPHHQPVSWDDDLGQLPTSFGQRFYAEVMNGSGVAPEFITIGAVGLLEDTGYWEPNRALGHHVGIQWQTRPPHAFGALGAFYQETGDLWQGKPEHPLPRKDGAAPKYEYPAGAPLQAYLPPIGPEVRQTLAQRYGCDIPADGSFWGWLDAHPEIPIVITEGAKKQLSALSQGHVAIALVGVHGGILKHDRIGGEKLRRLHPELIEDLARFAVPGRRFILAFDQDTKEKTRHQVEGALADLSYHLEATQATVAIATWDGQNGRCKGLDDLIVNAGIAAWEKALAEACPAPVWRIKRTLTHRIRRQPDLGMGDAEFTEAIATIPRSGIIALWGGKGTGKTKLIKALLSEFNLPWASYCPLQSLAREQAEAFGGVFVNDGDRIGKQLLDAEGHPTLGGAVCAPSLLALSTVPIKVLVLDEVTAFLTFLHGSKLANQNGIRPLLEAEFIRRVRTADLVLVADADLTEETLNYLEALRGDRVFLVRSDRKPLPYPAIFLEGTRNQAIADFEAAAANIPDGKLLLLHSDSRSLVESLAQTLEAQGISTLAITQTTSGGAIEQDFLQSKGKSLPSLVASGVKVILCSPSVTQGFSIEHHTDLIHEIWGLFDGVSIPATGIAQALDRARVLVPRRLWVAQRGRGGAYSKLSRATTTEGILRDFEALSKQSLRLVAHSLQPATLAIAQSIDYGRENLKLLASYEAERNRGHRALRATVQALLDMEGKRVTVERCQSSRAVAQVAASRRQEAKIAKEIERAARVADRMPLTTTEAHALETRRKQSPTALSQQETEALERFYIAEFYRTEAVTPELVLWDNGGQRRTMVRNLEAVLNPAIAPEKTADSIMHNPNTPQDWNHEATRAWLLDKTGAKPFLEAIAQGEIQSFTPDDVLPVAKTIQRYPREFEIAFSVKNIDKLEPMQVITWLLHRHGITWETKRQRTEDGVIRVRVIDSDNLSKILAVIAARHAAIADPPPKKEGIKSRGVDHFQTPCSQADVADVLGLWAIAQSQGEQAAVVAVAIALGLPPDPEQWRAIAA